MNIEPQNIQSEHVTSQGILIKKYEYKNNKYIARNATYIESIKTWKNHTT